MRGTLKVKVGGDETKHGNKGRKVTIDFLLQRLRGEGKKGKTGVRGISPLLYNMVAAKPGSNTSQTQEP